MPYIRVTTNVLQNGDAAQIHGQLAEAMALFPDVKQEWTMTEIHTERELRFVGSDGPAAMVEILVYGAILNSGCEPVTRRVTELLSSIWDIDPSRIYIAYFEARYWGCQGSNYES